MKGLLLVSLLLFILSIVFRTLHWPFAHIMAIGSVFLTILFAIVNSFYKRNVFNIGVLGGWVLASWMTYILFKYMYWFAGPSVLGFNSLFLFVFLLTVVYFVATASKPTKKVSKAIVALTIIGSIFSFIPSYAVCYFFELNEVINKENNETNYYSWSRYSWFLYIRGEKERALDANQKSIDACHKNAEMYALDSSQELEILNALNKHKQGIIDGTWRQSDLPRR